MPGFCVNCGTPLTGPFCNNCGARAVPPGAAQVPGPPASAAQPGDYQTVKVPSSPMQPMQPMSAAPVEGYRPVRVPVVATPKSSGLGKALLWVGGILLVLFMAGATAAVYGAYWVKHKVSSYASAISGSTDSRKMVAKGDSCRLLSKAELQKVLGLQKRFGELAVETGVLTPEKVESALMEQKQVKTVRQERASQESARGQRT